MSVMLNEIYEQPQRIAGVLDSEGSNVAALAAEVKRRNIQYVVLAARGTSDHAAVYAKYLLEIMVGVPVSLAAPSVFTLYDATLKLDNCLVVGISQSGQATDVVQTLSAARATGALTACITNIAGSPITNVSDYTFLCSAGEEKAVAATKTYTTSLAIVALLAAHWSGKPGLIDALHRVPEQIQSTLLLDQKIGTACERYRYIQECAVLARGINQCTALEAALKMTETSYLVAKPFSGADFLHGPIAIVSEGFPCFLFAPDGRAYPSMVELALKLRARNAEMVVIARNPEILDLAARSIEVPVEVDEWLSPLVYIVPGQLWAYHLSSSRGCDPDNPRGLSKVTLTR